ncbi:MAG: hypothetical protein M1836_004513 [Candelina mexicana]|nr:MAG: hypothetical protein M1836_004513 [Candelina mexicana]
MHSDEHERSPLLVQNDSIPDLERDDISSESNKWGYLEHRQLYVALALPNLALLLAAIDATLTATVAATIASTFDSLTIISWLGSAYLVATVAAQPLSGKLTDRLGRRRGFIFALILFAIGNLLCGVAQNTTILVTGRAVAGAGGGAINSITAFIVNDVVPLRDRPIWQGASNCLYVVGMGLGGVVGGAMNDLMDWRWAFLGLTPLTLLVAIGSYFTLPPGLDIVSVSLERHIDVFGAITLTGTLTSLVLGLNIAEKGSDWLPSLALGVTATILLTCFVTWELFYAKDPVIPIRLLASRSVAAQCLSSLFCSASAHILVFYVPLQIQARGFNTTEVGVQLLGAPVGAILGSFIPGWAMRATGGYGLVKPINYLIFVAAALGFFLSNLKTPVWVVEVCLIAMEGGFSGVLTVLLTSLLAATEQHVQAVVTGMLYAFRQVGASSGLALAGILFRSRIASEMSRTQPLTTVENRDHKAVDNLEKVCHRHSYVGDNRPRQCVAYSNALHTVFLVPLIAGAVGTAIGMLIRNIPLDRDDKQTPTKSADSQSDDE